MSHDQFKDFQNATKINNKSFGIQLSIIFFIIFLIRLYLNFYGLIELILIFFSIFLFTISFIKTSLINPIRIFFLKLANFLSKFFNPIVMFIFYLFIFIPFGIFLKFFKYDPLKEKINKNLKSYWNYSKKNPKKYFTKQF